MAGKPSAFSFNKHTFRVILISSFLYGFCCYLTTTIPIEGSSLRPAVVVLTIFGALYGPVVGFLAGFIGSFVSDLLLMDVWIHSKKLSTLSGTSEGNSLSMGSHMGDRWQLHWLLFRRLD